MVLSKKNDVNIKLIKEDFIDHLHYIKPNFLIIDESLELNKIIFSFISSQTKVLWTVEELTFDPLDIKEYKNLSTNHQILIKSILLYFLFADKIVNSNIEKLKNTIPYQSAKYFYNLQTYIEDVHDRIYEKSARVYYDDDDKFINDKNFMQEIIDTASQYPHEEFDINNYISPYYDSLLEDEKKIFKAVIVKINLLNKWRNMDSFLHNLIAFFIIESVSFNGLFVIINLFKKNNKGLKYLIDINEFVARDESIHSLFGIEIYNNFILNKLPKDDILFIITSITNTEIKFFKHIMEPDFILDGYNREKFIDYIKNIANTVLEVLDLDPVYNLSDTIPIEFNLQTSNIKTNFFERQAVYVTNNKTIKTDTVLETFK